MTRRFMRQGFYRCLHGVALGAAAAATAATAAASAGCAGAPEAAAVAAATTETAAAVSCATPRSFGAIPDDGIDDRAALQAAFSAGCSPVVLEAGTYDIATPAVPRSVAMLTMPANLEIVGAGDTTVLVFAGDAGNHDWRGIQLGDNAIVHHLKIVTDGLTDTDEQTHAIRADGPLASPLVEYVTFHHPQRGLPGGDCLQLVGYPGSEITSPIIRNNNFAVCDRSGVAFHSGIHGGQITNNAFSDTGDQDIDGEGSGDVDGLEIGPGNTFAAGPDAQSGASFELELASNIHVHGNTFNGRGLFVYGCNTCEFDHDTITQTMAYGNGALEIQKDSSGISIHDETIVRQASAGTGATLRFMPHGSGTPSGITVSNNALTQHSGGTMIDAAGIVGLHITGNQIGYDGAVNGAVAINALGSAGTAPIRTTDIVLDSNTFTGGFQAVLHVAGSYGGTGTMTLTSNTAATATRGLWCENITTGSGVLGPVTYTGNTMPAPQCGSLVGP